MHEISLVQSILKEALDEAEKAGGKRVRGIHARLRESGHPMEAASLEVLLETIARGTIAEGAEMKVELVPPTLKCRDCGFTSAVRRNTLLCPHCRSSRLEALDADKIDLQCDFAE